MAKILVNAVSAKSGGAATYVHNLIAELARLGDKHEYCFFLPPNSAAAPERRHHRIRTVPTDIGSRAGWRRLLWDQITLRQEARRERADVLLSSSDFGVWGAPCRQVLMVRNPLGFSKLYHNTILPHKSAAFRMEFALRRALVAQSIKASDVVITASHSMLADVRRFIPVPASKAVVSYFGVPLDRFGSVANQTRIKPGSRLRVLHVSEYCEHKNLTILLKAFLGLRQQGVDGFRLMSTARPVHYPDAAALTVAEDKALASHPLLAACVTFTEPVSYQEIPQLYLDCDVFVLPSITESFCHPLVEAMASGLPVVASDIPICREICGDAALYFNPLDPKALADQLQLLRARADLRKRLGTAGRERAVAAFDWRRHVRQLVDVFERVAAA